MDGFWHDLVLAIFRSREVKSLMGLIGRMSWILAGVAIATLYTAPKEGELSYARIVILAYCGAVWLVLHLAAFVIGINWPEQLHYGAEQRIEIKRMEMGDSLAASASAVRRSPGKPREKA